TVIITLAHSDLCGIIRRFASRNKPIGFQLFLQKLIRATLVNHHRRPLRCTRRYPLDQQSCIIVPPFFLVIAEIMTERFFAPWAGSRIGYGSEGGYRSIALRVSQCNNERAVTSHGM